MFPQRLNIRICMVLNLEFELTIKSHTNPYIVPFRKHVVSFRLPMIAHTRLQHRALSRNAMWGGALRDNSKILHKPTIHA